MKLWKLQKWGANSVEQEGKKETSHTHTKEAITANINEPENDLKVTEHITYTWWRREDQQTKVEWQSHNWAEPKPFSHPTHRLEEEE